MKSIFFKNKVLTVLEHLIGKGNAVDLLRQVQLSVASVVCRDTDGFADLEDKVKVIIALLEKLQEQSKYYQLNSIQQVWIHAVVSDTFEDELKGLTNGISLVTTLINIQHDVVAAESVRVCEDFIAQDVDHDYIPKSETILENLQRVYNTSSEYIKLPYVKKSFATDVQLTQLLKIDDISVDVDMDESELFNDSEETWGTLGLGPCVGFYVKGVSVDKSLCAYVVGHCSMSYVDFLRGVFGKLNAKLNNNFTHEIVLIGGSISSLPEILEFLTFAKQHDLNISHLSVLKNINVGENVTAFYISNKDPNIINFSEPYDDISLELSNAPASSDNSSAHRVKRLRA